MQIQSQFIWSVQAQSNLLTDSKTNKWIKRFSDGVSRSSKLKLEDLINLQLNIVSSATSNAFCYFFLIFVVFFSYFLFISRPHTDVFTDHFTDVITNVFMLFISDTSIACHMFYHMLNVTFLKILRIMPRSHQPLPHTKKHRSELFVLHNISIFNSFIKHHFRHISYTEYLNDIWYNEIDTNFVLRWYRTML